MASNGYGGSKRSAWILPIKAVAASAVVLSTAVMLQISSPSILRFVSSEVPRIYGSLISWLTPPYLYFVINGIIISIAASSRFHKSASEDLDLIGSGSASAQPVVKQEFVVPPPAYEAKVEEVRAEYVVPAEYETVSKNDARVSNRSEVKTAAVEEDGEREDFVISRSSWTPKRTESTENLAEYSFLTEKPLVSSRLGRRKSLKASPEAGKALGVSRSKRNETLENTWKAITDGRAVPLTRHLKKSDTWEVHHTRREEPSPSPLMRKSETFNERGARRPPVASPSSQSQSPSPSAASRLRKEPSVGQDDLNRRVEAFIKKFNEEMRLQRQESLKHYMDMVNRGSH